MRRPPCLIVLPSTRQAMVEALEMQQRGVVNAVIGAPQFGLEGQGRLMGSLEDGQRGDIIVFSDQLAGVADAVVLTSLGGRRLYQTGLEALLCNTYGYSLGVRSPGFVRGMPAGTHPMEILRVLRRYLDDCAGLGSDWLAAPLQVHRLPAWRITACSSHLRLMHSALLFLAARELVPSVGGSAPLDRIRAVRRAISQGGDA